MSSPLDPRLDQALAAAASVDSLMLASDFDGCLSLIRNKPMTVVAQKEGLDALLELAQLPQTFGTIVSGRDMDRLVPLVARTGPAGQDVSLDRPDQVRDISPLILVGSHGSEANDGSTKTISEGEQALRDRIVEVAFEIGSAYTDQGLYLEPKPLGMVLHAANMPNKELAGEISARYAAILDELFEGTDASYMYGKDIIEAQVVAVNKGTWLTEARTRYNLDAIVFAGDDTTDENAFRVLTTPPDASIKVGFSDSTRAQYQIEKAEEIPTIYRRLLELRKEALAKRGVL